MHKITVAFACLLAIVTASLVPGLKDKKVEADKDFLMKEKSILQLLLHVHQPLMIPDLKEIAMNYKIEDNLDKYDHVELVKEFLKLYRSGVILPRGEIFSVLYKDHVKQVKSVFDVLYFAKDWDTFYKTAVWVREYVNEGMFVYALTVAVVHRQDTNTLILPPPYEIYPHFFVNAETIQKAYEARMLTSTKTDVNKDLVVIPTNYTAWYKNVNPELRLSYFTEDVGLNTYHYYHHVDYPFWLKGEEYGIKSDRRGEVFWYSHEQLLARYLLERVGNDLYEMEKFTFERPNIVGYSPNLRYKNGKDFPVRPEHLKLHNIDLVDVDLVKDFERRIRDSIDLGYIIVQDGSKVPLTTEQGMDFIGRLIEETMEKINPRYYGSLYNLLLNLVGHIVDPVHEHNVAPSVMEHFETMLRDPMYYRLFQRINNLFIRYKKTLPVYTKDDLMFPGVKIESLEVDKLMTYFENFDIDITNAVDVNKIEEDRLLRIVARQPRLNHKDFTYRVNVNSDKATKVMVRVFLGPKLDVTGREMTLEEQQRYMIEIDRFPYDVQSGKTTIERNSKDSTATVRDLMSFRSLYKKVEDAIHGKVPFNIDENMRQCGFPDRLLLPKGKTYGMQYKMFVMVTPFEGKTSDKKEEIRAFQSIITCGIMGNLKYPDTYPMGYPFDRQIDETEFFVPNMIEKDVLIYHKKSDEFNKDN